MTQKEKILFKSLCSFKQEKFDETLLDFATPAVLGKLFFNRMQSVAYGVLEKHGLLGKVNREFKNSLKAAYKQNLEKNKSFFNCIEQLEDALAGCNCRYAMLKGAYLCRLYPMGYRTSNDIDLLVHPKDVTEVGKALSAAGFKQGNVRNDEFEAATRKEIIESKMMRGETVPYIKEVNLPGIKFLEVDINFSLDYKHGDANLIEEMLNNASLVEIGDFKVCTLRLDDFFIHLCSHLYKEATTLPWIEMKRDMTLYKYADIYMLLNNADEYYVDFLFDRATKLGMEKMCAFAIIQTAQLFEFENLYATRIASKVLGYDYTFINKVISPKDKKELIFTEPNVLERFFADDRKKMLKEVNNFEKT
ncbi:MAG: nucleotidyltransferase family protein [Clostridia bacterium]|nr:nucleotidyltransferase family protein [Clostridia bacterium]